MIKTNGVFKYYLVLKDNNCYCELKAASYKECLNAYEQLENSNLGVEYLAIVELDE